MIRYLYIIYVRFNGISLGFIFFYYIYIYIIILYIYIYDGCFADSWGFPQFSQSTQKCLDFFVRRPAHIPWRFALSSWQAWKSVALFLLAFTGWLVPNQWDQRFHLKGLAYSQGRCVEFCWRFLTCYSVSTVPRLGWCLQENAYFSWLWPWKLRGCPTNLPSNKVVTAAVCPRIG